MARTAEAMGAAATRAKQVIEYRLQDKKIQGAGSVTVRLSTLWCSIAPSHRIVILLSLACLVPDTP